MAMRQILFMFACLAVASACDSSKSGRASGGDGTGGKAAGRGGAPSGGSSSLTSTGGKRGTGYVPTSCADMATRACDRLASCEPFRFGNDYGDAEACHSRLAGVCDHFAEADRPLDMAACAAAVDAPHCGAIAAYAGLPVVCRLPAGAAAGGVECGRDGDCQSLACSKKGACGVCTSRGEVGAACSKADDCDIGLVCNLGSCAAPVAPGDACHLMNDNRCPAGTFCVDEVCTAHGAAGDACGILQNCNAGLGFVCRNTECIQLTVAAEGEACGSAAPNTACGAGLVCAGPAEAPVCVRRHAVGEACSSRAECLVPLSCTDGVCSYEEPDTCG
jgi:hypothetical protein